jgi:YbbR domain-containing protein
MISLILALVLWFYVAGELERGLWWKAKKVTFYEVPIRIMSLPDKEFNVNIEPDKANIVLSSYRSDIESITRDNIILFVNLTNFTPATYEVQIESIVPRDLTVVKIEPYRVLATISSDFIKPFSSDTSAEEQQKQEAPVLEQKLSEPSF